MAGSVKFVFLAMDSQRAGLAGIALGILFFFMGICLCVWSITGPPG